MMATSSRNHYETLEIERDADDATIRRAWRLLVQVWHPDRFDGDMQEEAERRTAAINDAYNTLRDAGRRAAYDCRLAADEAQQERASGLGPQTKPADRVGAPHVHAVYPRAHAANSSQRRRTTAQASPLPKSALGTLGELGDEFLALVKKHPRVVVICLAAWFAVVGAGVVWSSVTAPKAPTRVVATSSDSHSLAATPASHLEESVGFDELAELADKSRQDSEREGKLLAEQLRRDAAELAREQAEADEFFKAQERAALRAQAKARSKAAKNNSPKSDQRDDQGGRVVRVMPARPDI